MNRIIIEPEDRSRKTSEEPGLGTGMAVMGAYAMARGPMEPTVWRLATESALGLLPTIALSSAQSGIILRRWEKMGTFAVGF
ncbi:MAG: hypothetical protein WB974_01250 [Acidobacteriaceae bacterium]